MIDLYSFRNWLIRLLAGNSSIVINANVWARVDVSGDKPYTHNLTFGQTAKPGTVSMFPPPTGPTVP